MGKHHDERQHSGNENRVKIYDDAQEFARLSFKKYKKKYGDDYDKKKEVVIGYHLYLIELLPKTIEFIVRYGHIKDDAVQETKDAIYGKLVDEDFIKTLRKEIKGGTRIDNIKWLPIIIKDILLQTDKANKELLAENPNAKLYDMSDLLELCQLILKKKLKKLVNKGGIDEAVALDALCVIPTDEVMDFGQNFRIRSLFDSLYEDSKTKQIKFANLIERLVGEEYFIVFIVFALLERKEKFGTLTDAQKTFYLEVSNWVFATMEKELSKEQLREVVNTYIRVRRRDESQGKDGNRRYALSTLSETDYPRIAGFIKTVIANDDTVKKYL